MLRVDGGSLTLGASQSGVRERRPALFFQAFQFQDRRPITNYMSHLLLNRD